MLLGFWLLSYASSEGTNPKKKHLLESQPYFEPSRLLSYSWHGAAGVE